MKRRRFPSQGESLDLLLDTICNAFGGIIFIACLVTLLVKETDTGPNPALEESRGEILARSIATTKEELERLKFLIAAQEQKRGLAEGLAAEANGLLAIVTDLRKQADKASSEMPRDPTGGLQKLIARSQLDRETYANLEEKVAGQEAVLKDLLHRSANAERGMKAALHKSRQNVRLPLERPTDKKQFGVILKYHCIYHQQDASGRPNTAAIDFREDNSIRPRDGLGAALPRDRASILAQLSALQKETDFVVVWLYPDSHDTWRDYFQLLHQEAGLEYGLQLCEQDSVLSFGANNAGVQ